MKHRSLTGPRHDAAGALAIETPEGAPLVIGVLGDANAGKSTLLNALVFGSRALLPSSGVGAVTGRATRLKYSARPILEFRFGGTDRLVELCYALEHLDAARGGRRVVEADYTSLDGDHRGALRRSALAEALSTPADGPADAHRIVRIASQAKLLVFGDPDRATPLGIVRAAMRRLLSLPVSAHEAPGLPDEHLLFRVRQLTRLQDRCVSQLLDVDDPSSVERMAAHVSGALSVLTDEVIIGWPCAMLQRGIELVDLPGVGVASDAHQLVTRRWLEASFESLLLVCTRSGISTSCSEALVTSGAARRILSDWNPERPSLVVAVTKLDDEACQVRRTERAGSLLGHFEALSRAVKPVIQRHVGDLLRRVAQPDLASRADAIARTVPVISVAAPSYLSHSRQDDELRTFFEDPSQTNIPRLASLLGGLGRWSVPSRPKQDEPCQIPARADVQATGAMND